MLMMLWCDCGSWSSVCLCQRKHSPLGLLALTAMQALPPQSALDVQTVLKSLEQTCRGWRKSGQGLRAQSGTTLERS